MTPEELVGRLQATIPEFEIDECWLDESGPLTYLVFGDFAGWLQDRVDTAGLSDPVERLFALIEQAWIEGDRDVHDLLAVELFEGFPWSTSAVALMGPVTRDAKWIHELAVKAESEPLEPGELDAVAGRLRRRPIGPHPLLLRVALGIVGRVRATELRELVEGHLESPPVVATEALRVLCLEWGDAARYEPLLLDAMTGRVAGGDLELRIEACLLAGRHLRTARAPALLGARLAIVEDRGESAPLRDAAYHALGQAARKPTLYGPVKATLREGEPAPDDDVIARARAAIAGA